jgi:hypothetical protein
MLLGGVFWILEGFNLAQLKIDPYPDWIRYH